jgi:hypothetical protein
MSPEYGDYVYCIRPRLHRFSHFANGTAYAICGAYMPIMKKPTKRRKRKYTQRHEFLTWCKVCCNGPQGA